MSRIPDLVLQKLDTLPASPGCYQMLDAAGKVLYVGKALVLRHRVRSYFHASAHHSLRTQALVAEIADISWWVTKTELEALVLENELIKRYQPHYNVRLKDDKTFPYIKVNWQEDFPKIQVVRRIRKDGARYFGPYTSSRACYETLDALRRIFPYLDCDRPITGTDARPCLYYHIKLCGGPCIGAQDKAEYRQTLQQLMHFLEGESDRVLRQLQQQMVRAAENLQFELAAIYRDRLQSAQRIAEQQKIVTAALEDLDYIAVAQDERTGDTAVQVFMVRHGRLVGRDSFLLEGAELFQPHSLSGQESSNPETDLEEEQGDPPIETSALEASAVDPLGTVVGAFVQQFYDNATFIPALILVQALPPSLSVLSTWLAGQRGAKVALRVPRRGDKVKMMALAVENATEFLRVQQATPCGGHPPPDRGDQRIAVCAAAAGPADPHRMLRHQHAARHPYCRLDGCLCQGGTGQRGIQALQTVWKRQPGQPRRLCQPARDAAPSLSSVGRTYCRLRPLSGEQGGRLAPAPGPGRHRRRQRAAGGGCRSAARIGPARTDPPRWTG